MLSETDKTAVFTGLPKTVTIGSTVHAAHIEYADRGHTVTKLLEDNEIVATLRYYNDLPDVDSTPGNCLLGRTVVDSDIQYIRGKIRRVTASLNIYARDSDDLPAADLVDPYANAVLLWVQNTLSKLMSIAVDPTVSDLNYLEAAGTERRQVEWVIRYELSAAETVKTIDTVDTPTFTLS